MNNRNGFGKLTTGFSFGFLLLGIFVVLLFLKLLAGSLFLKNPDRVQFVVYGQETRLYSLNPKEDINYYVSYDPDLKVEVPNGYGSYRIGALSKLISYEKKPELLSRAFSLATSSFVSYYFYPSGNEIYYSRDTDQNFRAPSFTEIMLFKSNARLLDRIYIYLNLLQSPPNSYQNLDIELLTKKNQKQTYLSAEAFGKEYKGFLYNKTYRKERLSVQIKYTKNYITAVAIGKILEGSGVRVVDISASDKNPKKCTIVTDFMQNSSTVRDIGDFLKCEVAKGKADTSDILLLLGDVEKYWEL